MKRRRFVLLRHEHQGTHYDLMFEDGSVLRTWKLSHFPERGGTELAEKSFNHRLAYLNYEGPISGDRGVVTRTEAGWFEGDFENPSLHELLLDGNQLRGRLTLKHADGDQWKLAYSPGPPKPEA